MVDTRRAENPSCQVRAADFISFVAVRRDGDRPWRTGASLAHEAAVMNASIDRANAAG